MSSPEAKFNQVCNEIDSINTIITELKRGIREATIRLEKLYKGEFHIERILMNAQLIEQAIKMIIRSYQTKGRILEIFDLDNPYADISVGDFEEQTLGYLIRLLTKFAGQDSFISQLWDFNNRFRKDFAHHIFNGKFDIKKVDEEAKVYLSSKEFIAIIGELLVRLVKVQEETHHLYLIEKQS